jgi:5-methylcytosine-specific restriction endonuclease McrA
MLRRCLDCPRLTPESRCPDHKRAHQQARDAARAHDPIRVFRRSAAWIRTSREFRAAHPGVCVLCGATSDLTTGHVVPLADCLGTGLELDWGNLRVECVTCQNRQGHQQRRSSF